VWLSAGGSRALRWTAGFLLAANVITTPLHPFFPMSSRGMETGFNDTMHLILTMAFGLFVFGAVAASAVAIRGWFRLYAIASLAVIMAFGGLTGPLMSEIANNQPTPWLGAFERINAYTTFAWMVVLAIVLIRRNVDERNPEAGGASVRAPADRALATIPPR
jgi:F0F1-type ATP synthase membrane subunit a